MAGPILCSPTRNDTDADVLARLVNGSPEAFDEIYRRYSRYVAAIGFRLLGDDSELDDLVQDTFIEVAGGIGTLRDPNLFKSWLGTIAVRGVLRRRGRRRRTRFIHHTLSVFGITRSDPRTREPVDELYDWLDRVPERSRSPWLIHRIVGESLEETAAMCGCSLTTAKRRIADVESRLRRHLDAR
jgi:RNA polymerase sigma-70 factor (ECF subfamily)